MPYRAHISCWVWIGLIMLHFGNSTHAEQLDVWIGTGGGEGIFHTILDTETGRLSPPRSLNTLGGAGFLALHPNGAVLMATAQQGRQTGIASYRIVPNQPPTLERTGFADSGDGGAACVAVDTTGRLVFSAQYGGGSIATYEASSDGTVDRRAQLIEQGPGSTVIPDRQHSAHPHWVGTSPDNRFLLVPDLGMDQVVIYRIEETTGQLTAHSSITTPPGSGPRHMKFHPQQPYAYILNELSLSITAVRWDASSGQAQVIQQIDTLPESMRDHHLNSAAEIRVHPSGRFLYASNRGHDSISVFSIDPTSGRLELIQREPIRGSIPRNFNLDPKGHWLIAAGQASNTLSVFEIDSDTGKLVFHRQVVNVPSPICVEFGRP